MTPFTKAANKATPARTIKAVSTEGIFGFSQLPASGHGARHHSPTGHRVVDARAALAKIHADFTGFGSDAGAAIDRGDNETAFRNLPSPSQSEETQGAIQISASYAPIRRITDRR